MDFFSSILILLNNTLPPITNLSLGIFLRRRIRQIFSSYLFEIFRILLWIYCCFYSFNLSIVIWFIFSSTIFFMNETFFFHTFQKTESRPLFSFIILYLFSNLIALSWKWWRISCEWSNSRIIFSIVLYQFWLWRLCLFFDPYFLLLYFFHIFILLYHI